MNKAVGIDLKSYGLGAGIFFIGYFILADVHPIKVAKEIGERKERHKPPGYTPHRRGFQHSPLLQRIGHMFPLNEISGGEAPGPRGNHRSRPPLVTAGRRRQPFR
jgi:hypothetical protein